MRETVAHAVAIAVAAAAAAAAAAARAAEGVPPPSLPGEDAQTPASVPGLMRDAAASTGGPESLEAALAAVLASGASAIRRGSPGEDGSDDDERKRTPSKFSDEDRERWLQKRRENHKEVERRRRDNINVGIQELAKLVPECEKNKGSILHKSADYIKYLQRTNLVTIEKWREEKKEVEDKLRVLNERIDELRRENDMLREQLNAAADPASKKRKLDE